jgi:starch synthase (maltosyl-transferring)
VRETTVRLDLTKLGLPAEANFEVQDLITGERYHWSSNNFVRLDAFDEPAHILHVVRTKKK